MLKIFYITDVHAAPPHNAAINIRLFLGGLCPPQPSRGRGRGETRFPHTLPGRGGGTGAFHQPVVARPQRGRQECFVRLPGRRGRERVRGEAASPHSSTARVLLHSGRSQV